MITIKARNAPQALEEALYSLRVGGKEEESRNGKVIVMPAPVLLTITHPMERVINSAERNANHFYHLMEMVWMMAGERDVRWLSQFNKGVLNYCDKGETHWHGAYGYRWRNHFKTAWDNPRINQIKNVVNLLRKDPNTRRAVIGMWDPAIDLEPHNDLPCNTHIYFRNIDGKLDMTVCNRSNDLIWGMLGANVVHMTYLQELVAWGAGLQMGHYHVFTNNLHVYRDREDFQRIWDNPEQEDIYAGKKMAPMPLTQNEEAYEDLLEDCRKLIIGARDFNTLWMKEVGYRVFLAYTMRKDSSDGMVHAEKIMAADWRKACTDWIKRKDKK